MYVLIDDESQRTMNFWHYDYDWHPKLIKNQLSHMQVDSSRLIWIGRQLNGHEVALQEATIYWLAFWITSKVAQFYSALICLNMINWQRFDPCRSQRCMWWCKQEFHSSAAVQGSFFTKPTFLYQTSKRFWTLAIITLDIKLIRYLMP